MKARYAYATHDLRLESCEDTLCGSGQVTIRMRRVDARALPDQCQNMPLIGPVNPFPLTQGGFLKTLAANAMLLAEARR